MCNLITFFLSMRVKQLSKKPRKNPCILNQKIIGSQSREVDLVPVGIYRTGQCTGTDTPSVLYWKKYQSYRMTFRRNPDVSAGKEILGRNTSNFFVVVNLTKFFKGNMVIVLNSNSNPKGPSAQPSFFLSRSLSTALCLSLSWLLCLSISSYSVFHSLSRLLILCSLSLGHSVSRVLAAISHSQVKFCLNFCCVELYFM